MWVLVFVRSVVLLVCLFVCLRLVYAPLVPECLWPPGCTSFDSLSIGVQLGQRVAREFHGKWAWVFGFGCWVLGAVFLD